MYLATIRQDTTPRHIMSVRDSLYVLGICMEGGCDEADEIVDRFAKNSRER